MHRFAKLRSVASENGETTTAGAKASPTKPATPRKRKAPASKVSQGNGEDIDDDDDEDEDSKFGKGKKGKGTGPAKKRGPRAKKVKSESVSVSQSQSFNDEGGDEGEEKKLGVKFEIEDGEGPFGLGAGVVGLGTEGGAEGFDEEG